MSFLKKIRCWDKQQNKYLTLEDYQRLGAIHIENDGTLSLSPEYRFADSMMICTEAFIPEYNTELLDYNKVEVFEGDIVQDVEAEDYGIVIFEDGHFYINTPGILEDIEDIWSFAIVGNKHDPDWQEVVNSIEEYCC